MKINAGNIKKGEFVLYQDKPHQVLKAEFYSPGKGSALMRTRLKNVESGKQVDYTFKSNEIVETIEVVSLEMQYLYKDAENMYAMDKDYEQYTIPLTVAGDAVNYLKEGETIFVYMYAERPLAIRPPATVRLTVIETEDAVKGDTVSGARKPAIVETGITVMVPLFVKQGETIVVNPETGEYTERAN
ncbi:MAG: elongation factor P [Patescibacteria group bacterium]|nr:elongation factor P [Patescibacteria group bacterium]